MGTAFTRDRISGPDRNDLALDRFEVRLEKFETWTARRRTVAVTGFLAGLAFIVSVGGLAVIGTIL